MTKLTLTLAALLVSGSVLACGDKPAQKHEHKTPCAEGMCPHKSKQSWSKLLELEGEKAEQVDAIQQDIRAQKKALKEQKNNRLAEILSDEELAKLEQKCDHKKAHGKRCDDKKKGNPLTQ